MGTLGNDKIDFLPFKKHANIRDAIGQIIPGFEKIKDIDRTKEEFVFYYVLNKVFRY